MGLIQSKFLYFKTHLGRGSIEFDSNKWAKSKAWSYSNSDKKNATKPQCPVGIHTIAPAFKGQECINKLQKKNTTQISTLLPSCFFFDSFELVEGVWSWSIHLLPIFNKVQCNDKACCNKLHISKTMGRYMRSLLDTNFQFLHHLIFSFLLSKYSCKLLIIEKKQCLCYPHQTTN